MKAIELTFSSQVCKQTHTAPQFSALGMLLLCPACQAKRFAAGLAEQRGASK